MRKIVALLSVVLLLSSCMKDKLTKTYTVYEPVYRDKATVLSEIKSNSPQSIKNPGKIYKYGNYIFLNDINKGVHVIDNSNPSAPVIKAFINIPGNVDIAVKGNILYADLYTDMVVVNIADPLNAVLAKTVANIFPERKYTNGFIPDSTKVIVDWIEKEITIRLNEGIRSSLCANCAMALSSGGGGGVSGSPATGVGGSMARFAIVNDYLYAVNLNRLEIMNISSPVDPVSTGSNVVGQSIETIYPFNQKLFIGSSLGMFVYSISNPASPVREGSFAHARLCDPVVADNNYAFVTLRSGNFCQGVQNQLDIVNVQNVLAPVLTKTYSMTNPFGLGKDGNLLFICDGRDGLKIYDAANVNDLRLLRHFRDMETYDVIVGNNLLLLVAKGGLYQYDYSNPTDIRFLSKLSLNK